MVAEIPESGESVFQSFNASEENTSEIWNGREVRVAESSEDCIFAQSTISSLNTAKSKLITQTISRTVPSSRGWNHESFPTPPTKPILTPVPDGDACIRFANGFKNHLLEWMRNSFVRKNLMDNNDYYHIESILQAIVCEVENYALMAGLYNRDVDWKEVLHPMNRLHQFWKNKWQIYSVPPSPYDYPLP